MTTATVNRGLLRQTMRDSNDSPIRIGQGYGRVSLKPWLVARQGRTRLLPDGGDSPLGATVCMPVPFWIGRSASKEKERGPS